MDVLPIDVLSIIIKKSGLADPYLCNMCFIVDCKCTHYDKTDMKRILEYKLIDKQWNKCMVSLIYLLAK